MFVWFWTIFSLGAPEYITVLIQRLAAQKICQKGMTSNGN